MQTEPLDPPTPAAPADLPEGRLQGRLLFADLVRQALAVAAAEAWSQLVLCDADFTDWPLGERAVVQALDAWAKRGRLLQLLARDFGPLRQQHPRFVQWRTRWSHRIEARAVPQAGSEACPGLIWSPSWTLERLDPERAVVLASRDAQQRQMQALRLAQWWAQAQPGFAPTTLGL